MNEERFEETERDILVGLRVELRYIRQSIDNIMGQVNTHAGIIKGHEESINTLTWGFRLIMGGVITVLVGVLVYSLTRA